MTVKKLQETLLKSGLIQPQAEPVPDFPTHQKRTLDQSGQLMRRAVFEQLPIGKVLQTPDGLLRAINRTLCLVLGYSEAELLTLAIPELIRPQDVTKDWAQYQDLLAGKLDSFMVDKRTFQRCGRAIWGQVLVSAIRDHAGDVEWVIAQLQELIPGLEPGTASRPPNPVQDQLQEMAHMGSWELNLLTRKISWSDHLFRILGLEPGAITPNLEQLLSFIHADDRESFNAAIRRTSEQQREIQLQSRVIRADGCLRQVLIQVRVQVQSKHSLLGLIADITEQWEKARLMEQAQILLAEQNRQLDHFVRLATHNLRGPLANAISLSQMLVDNDFEDEKSEIKAMLARSLDQTLNNLDEMVVQVYHQLPEGLEHHQLSFQDALDKALLVLATDYQASDARIETDFAQPELNYVSVYLNSIFYNLISNAIKYQHPERPPLIQLRSWQQDGKTWLAVQDNGIGIDLVRYQNKIFKMHAVFSDHKDAQGIGLYLTRNQIESLGGTINVSSEPGSGTRFLIRF